MQSPDVEASTDTVVGDRVEPEVTLFARALLAQHERLRELLDAVLDRTGDERDDAFDEFRRYLAAHEAAERLAMHPLFLGRDRDDPSVLERLAEEDRLAEQVTELEVWVDRDDEEFALRFAEVALAVTAHTELEERDELPGYLHRITADDAAELLDVLARVEELGRSAEALVATTPFRDMLEACEAELDEMLGQGSAGG